MKRLVKKFSFDGIIKEIESHDWKLPSSSAILLYCKSNKCDGDLELVWTSDIPSKEEDVETHGVCIHIPTSTLVLVNKKHMHNIIILRSK